MCQSLKSEAMHNRASNFCQQPSMQGATECDGHCIATAFGAHHTVPVSALRWNILATVLAATKLSSCLVTKYQLKQLDLASLFSCTSPWSRVLTNAELHHSSTSWQRHQTHRSCDGWEIDSSVSVCVCARPCPFIVLHLCKNLQMAPLSVTVLSERACRL